ncbi:MAG: hypothetical protein QXL81_00505 [Candidatus Aenigmatarchaeota archaeon]
MRLPVSVMIGIAIIVVALVAIIAFFWATGGGAAAQAELQNIFTQNCMAICANPERSTMNLANAYPEWQRACEQLYGIERGAFVQCLERCECARLAGPCEFLCGFKDTVADWPTFCERVRTNAVSKATYGGCDCAC